MWNVVEETTRDKQADYIIPGATGRALESKSFVENITQHILEDENVINSFITHDKRPCRRSNEQFASYDKHGKKAIEISDCMKMWQDYEKMAPAHKWRCPNHAVPILHHAPATQVVNGAALTCQMQETETQTLTDIDSHNLSQRSSRKLRLQEAHLRHFKAVRIPVM